MKDGNEFHKGVGRGAVAALALVGLLILFVMSMVPTKQPTSAEDIAALSYLNSAVFDLQHPTPENKTMRDVVCADQQGRLTSWKKAGASDALLKDYVEGCTP